MESDILFDNVPNKSKKVTASVIEWIEVVVFPIVGILLLNVFFLNNVAVKGDSMLPTLHDKEQMLVFRYVFTNPKPKDIVIIENIKIPGHERIVKRIIAGSGQRFKISSSGGVYVDGKLLDEPYINEPIKALQANMTNMKLDQEIVVSKGEYVVLGDNRNYSSDSRDIRIGYVKKKDIVGRAAFVLVPISDFRILH
ncbi:MAG: signal peptidase I [Oscillospiraceae bacterium]|nr:signal peptidase I [Oscillospiraceae bacterium]